MALLATVKKKGVLMCFSARMSFMAVGLLVSIAIATYRKVRTFKQIPLASIPAIFALQQLAEGVLWLLLPQGTYPGIIALCKYTFLGIALIFWPIFAPLSILMIEPQPIRRAIMGVCLLIGIGWSLATLWYMVHIGATVEIRSCHLYYQLLDLEYMDMVRLTIYTATLLVPLLASSNFHLRLLGCLIGVSGVLAYFIWYQYFISVWCFFAAFLSFAIYKVISDQKLD